MKTCRPMPPKRTKIRVFTAKDVRRIAKYAVDDGASPLDVLAGVGVFIGFGWLFCVSARAVDNSFNILKWMIKIGGILAISKIVDFLLTVVSGGLFKRLPKTNRITLLIIIALGVMESLLRAVANMIDSAHLIADASDTVHELCSKAKDVAISLGEEVGDKYDDTADFTSDVFERITETEVDKAFRFRNLP